MTAPEPDSAGRGSVEARGSGGPAAEAAGDAGETGDAEASGRTGRAAGSGRPGGTARPGGTDEAGESGESGESGAAEAGDRDARDPAERGETTVVERVVAKLAVQAAREALRSAPAARLVPPGARHWPRASARVRDDRARVRVLVELGYPSDIGAQCDAVRRQVAARVRELAGMDVPHVAVGVERLHSEQLDGERSGRVR